MNSVRSKEVKAPSNTKANWNITILKREKPLYSAPPHGKTTLRLKRVSLGTMKNGERKMHLKYS